MRANSPEEAMEHIINNYNVQLDKYQSLLTLSQEQLAAARDTNTVLVDQILDRRQQVITEIDLLNTGLKDQKANLIQMLNIKDFNLTVLHNVLPVSTQELQKVIVQIGAVLEKTAELDLLNQQSLSQGLKGISEEIKRAKTFREVRSAYNDYGSKNKEAIFIDRSE